VKEKEQAELEIRQKMEIIEFLRKQEKEEREK
jgi:hypothetical protein